MNRKIGCATSLIRLSARASFAAVLALVTSQLVGQAAAEPVLCVPPAAPVLPSDPAMQREYRDVLSSEYDKYFQLSGQYLTCLNDASSQARQEVNDAIKDYQRLLNLPRRQASGDAMN